MKERIANASERLIDWFLGTQLDDHVCEWANLTAGEDER